MKAKDVKLTKLQLLWLSRFYLNQDVILASGDRTGAAVLTGLAKRGLIQHTGIMGYVITKWGREVYEQSKKP